MDNDLADAVHNDDGEDKEIKEKVAQLEQEREELVVKVLRLQADFENYRRRMEQNLVTIRESANETLLVELLPVVDNFERAVVAADEESPLVKGVKMILAQLQETLKRQGLEHIPCLGRPFDPNLHEAMAKEGDADGPLIVTKELQKGYCYRGKVVRASLVDVATMQEEDETWEK